MSSELHPLEQDKIKATIEHIRQQGEHMAAEQDKWRREQPRETVRLVAYCMIAGAALLAAGAGLGQLFVALVRASGAS